ncbi:MAG: hypothetical protein EOM55_02545 [Clostridia bacterium]|nr:hypothetical protein [Clostridia bacterium]
MKSLTLKYENCIYKKSFPNGLKEKVFFSTKMEKLCKKRIINKIDKSANFIDLPFQNKEEVKNIQLFGLKISRLFSRFVLVGQENVTNGTKAIFSIIDNIKDEKDKTKNQINFEIISSDDVQKLNFILEKEEINKTFFNFVIKDDFDIETLSLFSLTIARLKEEMRENFFVNIVVTTQEGNNLWNFCVQNKIKTLKFPKDIDEKYCTLSHVGLFPMAVLGLDLEKVLTGAKQMLENFKQERAEQSPSFSTALIIYNFYKLKKRQIFFKTVAKNLQDLIKHFEVLVNFFEIKYSEKIYMIFNTKEKKTNLKIPKLNENIILPKTFQEINTLNCISIEQALKEKKIPSFSLEMLEKTDDAIGQIVFHFELASVILRELFKTKTENDFENFKNEKIKILLSSNQKSKQK